MALISIEEGLLLEQQPFRATVSINHGAKYSFTVQSPFSPQQEETLEWYFEEHLRFLFTHQVRATEAAASIGSYGEALFNQVFADRQAYSVYKECVQAGLPTLQIEIVGSPAFQSLHWEALKDPDLPMPLSLQATMVRKNTRPLTPEESQRLHERNASRYTPSQPSYGFVGRDLDILQIEKRLRCIDYSHSNLSPEAQSLLTCLAPFTSVLFLNIFDTYSALLKEQAALAHLPFDRWQDVLKEANNWGLLSPDPAFPQFLRLQPIFPYFLRTRLNIPEQAALRQAIETAFLGLYKELSRSLYRLLNSKEPKEKQLGLLLTQYEYENLRFAVNLALLAHTSILDPYYALSDYFNLMQDPQRGLEVAQEIQMRLSASKTEQSAEQINKQQVKIFDDIARWQMQLKHYAEAEQYYQQALQIYVEYNDRYSQASTYGQLGLLAEKQHQWEQAQAAFYKALEIFVEYGDTYRITMVLNGLARIWKETNESKLILQVTSTLKISAEEVEAGFHKMLGTAPEEAEKKS